MFPNMDTNWSVKYVKRETPSFLQDFVLLQSLMTEFV